MENAENSNGRLVRSLEKLAKTVVTVNDFVKDGKARRNWNARHSGPMGRAWSTAIVPVSVIALYSLFLCDVLLTLQSIFLQS